MRGSLIGSTLAHLTLLVALFAVPKAAPMIVPGPDVVQVALVGPETAQPRLAPAPPRETEDTAEEIKPTEESGVKIARVRPPAKKKAETPGKPEPQPAAVALPYAPAGNAGLRGQIAVDGADFEFTYYLLLVRNRVAQNWTPPAGLVTAGRPVRAVVRFRIARDGEVSDVRVEEGSAVEFFDRSALRAVLISAPLPPLPLGFSSSELGVHFGFEYSGL
jgi:protein TonB